MTGDQVALLGLGVTVIGQLGTVAVVIWRSGRKDGQLVTEAQVMTAEVRRLASAMERHADELAAVTQDNAVQDSRLDGLDRRLDNVDKEIDHLWRK